MASLDPIGEVSASTGNCPGAPAERVSERVPARLTTAAHAGKDRCRRDPLGTPPWRRPELVRRRASRVPLPQQGGAAGTMSLVLGRPPRAPHSCPVDPGALSPRVEEGTKASGKPAGAPKASRPDEARRTTRGQEARQRSTPPGTTKAHGHMPSNNGHWVRLTRVARTPRRA